MHRPRLSDATFQLATADRPGYDRGRVSSGVVHLGLGAFARGHLAVYLDDLLAAGHHRYGITGVSLRSGDITHALAPQDWLYTVGAVEGTTISPRVVASVLEVLHAPTQPARVRQVLAARATSVISMTVTEKGYCTDSASKRLDLDHPDIRHDLRTPEHPRSLPGQLLLAARDRRDQGTGGATLLSLDNMPANGHTLHGALADLAAATDASLADWIEAHFRFPCSMVDRITPATDAAFRERVAELTGLDDAWPVKTEPYSQWVVERGWYGATPPLDEVGVSIVDDVAPWETMKLRILNGMHTAAAHYGLRHGLDTIDEVTASREGHGLLRRVAAEVTEVLTPPPGVDLPTYVAATLRRFANPALGHLCAQIATDTSQKLPQRLLDTVRLRLDRGLPIDGLAETIALWAWSTLGRDHTGAARTVNDPLAVEYAVIAARSSGDPAQLTAALLAMETIFGDLAGNPRLVGAVTTSLRPLLG